MGWRSRQVSQSREKFAKILLILGVSGDMSAKVPLPLARGGGLVKELGRAFLTSSQTMRRAQATFG